MTIRKTWPLRTDVRLPWSPRRTRSDNRSRILQIFFFRYLKAVFFFQTQKNNVRLVKRSRIVPNFALIVNRYECECPGGIHYDNRFLTARPSFTFCGTRKEHYKFQRLSVFFVSCLNNFLKCYLLSRLDYS